MVMPAAAIDAGWYFSPSRTRVGRRWQVRCEVERCAARARIARRDVTEDIGHEEANGHSPRPCRI
jgi:hypothetical protein